MFDAILARIIGRVINDSDVQSAIDRFIDSGIIAAKDWLAEQRAEPDTRLMWKRLRRGGLKSAVSGTVRQIAVQECILTGASFFAHAKHKFHDIEDVAFLCPAELCKINCAIAMYKKYHNLQSMSLALPDDNERALALLSLGFVSVADLVEQKRIYLQSKVGKYLTLGDELALVWGSRKEKSPIPFGDHQDYFLFAHLKPRSRCDLHRFAESMIDHMANHLTKEECDLAGRAWSNLVEQATKERKAGAESNGAHCPRIDDMRDAYVFRQLP